MKKLFKKYFNIKLLLLVIGVIIAKVVIGKLFKDDKGVKISSTSSTQASSEASGSSSASVEIVIKGQDIIDVIDKSFKSKVSGL